MNNSFTMHNLMTFFAGLFMLFLFAGCDENHTAKPSDNRTPIVIGGSVGGNSQEIGPTISYKLPPEWEFKDDEPLKARLVNPSQGEVILEMSAEKIGTDSDAQKMAQDFFNLKEQSAPTYSSFYFETELGGRKVYAVEQYTDEGWGTFYWYTVAYFQKNGTVMSFSLDDHVQNHQEALNLALKTLEWK